MVIDTSTQRLLLGVQTSGGELRLFQQASQGNHASDIIDRIRELLDAVMPDRIGVALGPGSFTGLRIGLSVAKGLSEGWSCPLFGLDNLGAMSRTVNNLYPDSRSAVLCAIDARKKKYYGTLTHQGNVLISTQDWSAEAWLSSIREVWSGPVSVSGFQGDLLASEWGALPAGWEVLPVQDWTAALLKELVSKNVDERLGASVGPVYGRLSEAEEVRLAKAPNSAVLPGQAD